MLLSIGVPSSVVVLNASLLPILNVDDASPPFGLVIDSLSAAVSIGSTSIIHASNSAMIRFFMFSSIMICFLPLAGIDF